jgi:hypothetical protein
MEADSCWGSFAQPSHELFLLLLKIRQSIAEGAAIVPFFDRADNAGDLSLDGGELLVIRSSSLLVFRVGAVCLFVKRPNELAHELGREQLLLEPSKDALKLPK